MTIRLPFALDAIRKLAEAGHEVYASDSYERAPEVTRAASPPFFGAAPAMGTCSPRAALPEVLEELIAARGA